MVATGKTDRSIRERIVGDSSSIRSVLREAKTFARTDATVLIRGETGTGKELLARFLHYSSTRNDQPFIPVNCGAIPDELVENELFGHEAGAYTTARGRYEGLFSQACGGTLFLDEVNALSRKTQVALLRVLEQREYRPLGSSRSRNADVRLLAASNQSLAGMVAQGTFREDLYFRLQILRLELPPLRDRARDAELLAEHFLRTFCLQHSQPPKTLTACARAYLTMHSWPGNVRELHNTLLRAFLLCKTDFIDEDALRPTTSPRVRQTCRRRSTRSRVPFRDAKARAILAFERAYLTQLMEEAGGNVSRAARIAGKERRALGKLLKKHELDSHAQ